MSSNLLKNIAWLESLRNSFHEVSKMDWHLVCHHQPCNEQDGVGCFPVFVGLDSKDDKYDKYELDTPVKLGNICE